MLVGIYVRLYTPVTPEGRGRWIFAFHGHPLRRSGLLRAAWTVTITAAMSLA